jgi:hypothetical protein
MKNITLHNCKAWAEQTLHQAKDHVENHEVGQYIIQNPKPSLYATAIFLIAAYLLIKASIWMRTFILRSFQRPVFATPRSPDLEKPPLSPFNLKAPSRKPGEWTPMEFKRPVAPPAENWDVHTTKPNPYRPFRNGPYHITMGLRNMKWDEWIELDNNYLKFHADKAARIKERGAKCNHTAPEAFDGACELLEELCDYLPQRYPSMFKATPVGMDNLVTGESFNIVERPLVEDPMQMAGRFVQDDLAIMFEKEDGQYYLLAGSILLAGFWKLEDKLGMPLSEIHTSGDVPGFKEKLEKGMMNFFRRVQPNGPVQRVCLLFLFLTYQLSHV